LQQNIPTLSKRQGHQYSIAGTQVSPSFGVPDLVQMEKIQDRLLHRLLKLGIDASGCLRGCGGGVKIAEEAKAMFL
jgi:hypothetical protein